MGSVQVFFKATWGIVAADVLRVFQSLWDLDCRSFHLLNASSMVLLKKTDVPVGLKDYRLISLIHSVGKLFSKGLAMCLAPRMHSLVRTNQSAFIRGRQIHENFKAVQLTCQWLNAKRCPLHASQSRFGEGLRLCG